MFFCVDRNGRMRMHESREFLENQKEALQSLTSPESIQHISALQRAQNVHRDHTIQLLR